MTCNWMDTSCEWIAELPEGAVRPAAERFGRLAACERVADRRVRVEHDDSAFAGPHPDADHVAAGERTPLEIHEVPLRVYSTVK